MGPEDAMDFLRPELMAERGVAGGGGRGDGCVDDPANAATIDRCLFWIPIWEHSKHSVIMVTKACPNEGQVL